MGIPARGQEESCVSILYLLTEAAHICLSQNPVLFPSEACQLQRLSFQDQRKAGTGGILERVQGCLGKPTQIIPASKNLLGPELDV